MKDSRPGSTHASTKVLATRRMSRKDLEETNPLLAKEVAQAVSDLEVLLFFSKLDVCFGKKSLTKLIDFADG